MKTNMPARDTAQLESSSQAAHRQSSAQDAGSVLVDRRASAGTNLALQARLQDNAHAADLRALQAKMVPGQALAPVQRVEEEEMLQGKFDTAQRAGVEEEEPLQGKFDTAQRASVEEEEPLQGKFDTAQRASVEEEEPLQGKFETAQRAGIEEEEPLQGKFQTAPARANRTGMPDQLKSGIENLSGVGMDDVKVHYNSAKPAQLSAHAYAQGSDIHVAPGQEKHLPHEAWHVVQQRQGRVQPTMQMAGVQVNDDKGLENEADVMGAKALDQPT